MAPSTDSYFQLNLVPKVLQAISVDDKNCVLVKGLYILWRRMEQFRLSPTSWQENSTAGALKKVTALKNKARKQFREAKRKGLLRDQLATLAKLLSAG